MAEEQSVTTNSGTEAAAAENAPAAEPQQAKATEATAENIVAEGGTLTTEIPDFFVDEQVSEAELMGMEGEGGEKAGGEGGKEPAVKEGDGDGEKPSGQKDDDAAKAQPKEGADQDTDAAGKKEGDGDNADAEGKKKEGEGDDGQKKPPEGYVPYQALSEERGKRQALSQKLADLQADYDDLKARVGDVSGTGEGEEGGEFKVLSDTEFESLLEDDPQAAIRYQHKLARYQREQMTLSRRKADEQALISAAAGRIQQIIPGIYDEGSNAGEELGNFAVEHGLDPHFLTLLTDPRTKIIAPDSKGAVLLGEGAASVVSLLASLRGKLSESDPKVIEEKAREALREEITAEVMKKLKGGENQPSRGVLDVPGDAGDAPSTNRVMSEEEFAKLPAAEQERLLMGAV